MHVVNGRVYFVLELIGQGGSSKVTFVNSIELDFDLGLSSAFEREESVRIEEDSNRFIKLKK